MLQTKIQHVTVTETPPPGALAHVVEMQAAWYARNWGFGLPFEAKVAAEVGDFARALPHPDCGVWIAQVAGVYGPSVVGSIVIDGRAAPEARLRWFFVDDSVRGGLGRRLLGQALAFCEARNFREVWLTTFAGLHAARHLYEQAGFRLVHEAWDRTWGVEVQEQEFRLHLR
ncbi:GNAT family N-acetyltransferase [Falsiroseomonas oryziterrae]|uniref:GNAT family N-acetyltransferase n=1 Tax=Falsiroseomonas oryziterrae TaxID=2911368 RepID=UPI001F017D9F|nr:GNAT family N-acetyltransferase [Roseomonas sp. NPKOSM-4]